MEITKSCNICTDDIEPSQLVTLICNPNHYFCYTCIFDWYNNIKNNGSWGSYDNKQCTCPICKKDGGVLPLLPPHTEKIYGIHIKNEPQKSYFGNVNNTLPFGNVNNTIPFGFGFNNTIPFGFGLSALPLCQHKDCTIDALFTLKSKPNINNQTKTNIFCSTHYSDFTKGKNLILSNDEIFESTYIQCNCQMSNNTICKSITQNMSHINLNNKKYYLCNDHSKLYKNGIEITFHDNVKAIFKHDQNFVKNVCCTPNKSKYGYCLNYLNSNGLCKTKSHNKNILKNEPFNELDVDEIFEPNDSITKSNNKKVMKIHIGLCGTTLKNGNGNCQNKGKAIHNGKCGIHKNC